MLVTAARLVELIQRTGRECDNRARNGSKGSCTTTEELTSTTSAARTPPIKNYPLLPLSHIYLHSSHTSTNSNGEQSRSSTQAADNSKRSIVYLRPGTFGSKQPTEEHCVLWIRVSHIRWVSRGLLIPAASKGIGLQYGRIGRAHETLQPDRPVFTGHAGPREIRQSFCSVIMSKMLIAGRE